MALTQAQLQNLLASRTQSLQQATSGTYNPLELTASQAMYLGDTGKTGYNAGYNAYNDALWGYKGDNGDYNANGLDSVKANWSNYGNLTPLSYDQYTNARNYVESSPEFDFIDEYGRVIKPGTKVWNADKTGYFIYDPSWSNEMVNAYNNDPFKEGNSLYINQNDVNRYSGYELGNQGAGPDNAANSGQSWQWVSADGKSTAADNSGLLQWSGIYPKHEWTGAIGDVGWSAIKGIGSTLGAAGLSAATQAAGAVQGTTSGMSLNEMIANGASWAELAEAGFTVPQIISAGGLTSASSASLAANTGMSGGLSNLLVNSAYGGLKSGTQSAAGGKDFLMGFAGGGVTGGVNSGIKDLTSGVSWGGGDNMAEYDFSIPDSPNLDWSLDSRFSDTYAGTLGTDVGGLDTSIGGMDTGSGWGWLNNVDWSKMAAPLVGGAVTLGVKALSGSPNVGTGSGVGTEGALAAQMNMYNQQRADFAPYQAMGQAGVANYGNLLNNPGAYIGNSPVYQWQQQQLEKNMGRSLRNLGRENSTYGMNVMADANRNLAAQEYDKAYNRTIDQIKIGQGAAGSVSNAAQGMSTNYGQAGQQQQAQANQNYSNQQNSLYGSLGAGLSAYNALTKPTWYGA